MTLRIEQLTEDMEMSKTAEEKEMEKIAHVVNVIDQAQTLTTVGEELFKIASEIESEPLQALAADLFTGKTAHAAIIGKIIQMDHLCLHGFAAGGGGCAVQRRLQELRGIVLLSGAAVYGKNFHCILLE